MRTITSIAGALVLASVAVAMFAGSLLAQPSGKVYDACERGKGEIRATALPEVVDQSRCPVAGRTIVDGGVGAVVPEPGMSVISEAMSPEGAQHLIVSNPRGGSLVLEGVGRETESKQPVAFSTRASDPSACRDPHYTNWDYKLYNYNRWYFNGRSVPGNMSKLRVLRAIKRGGANITKVRDSCGIGDGTRGRLAYVGPTRRGVNISTNGNCGSNDFRSVVGFGNLPSSDTGKACIWARIQSGPNRITHADIRVNKFDYRWTARVTSGCRGRYDVESTITHERGHNFGLGEASESRHGNLTMSVTSNGTCQVSERSLGKGDAIGLNRKYR